MPVSFVPGSEQNQCLFLNLCLVRHILESGRGHMDRDDWKLVMIGLIRCVSCMCSVFGDGSRRSKSI